jgi:hypothetical protein
MLRWLSDRARGRSASEAETETSSGVLLSSGYIAGGTLCGLIIAFFRFLPDSFREGLDLSRHLGAQYTAKDANDPKIVALVMFVLLAAILLWVGTRKTPAENDGQSFRRET